MFIGGVSFRAAPAQAALGGMYGLKHQYLEKNDN